MRDALFSRMRSIFDGWLWVPVVLLVLPGCDQVFGLHRDAVPIVDLGPLPRTSALFCDIEKMSAPRHCATQNEIGIALSNAAVALSTRNSQGIGLDYSEGARVAAGCGAAPVVVTYEGRFPEGYPVCVKCLAILGGGARYDTVNSLCVDQCKELNVDNDDQTAVALFCQDHARASTNSPQDDCFGGACTSAGSLRDDFDAPEIPAFIDPRRIPEPVIWTDAIGAGASGNTLIRTAPTATPPSSNAGAASSQWILRGDAYVEFSAAETNRSHLLGFSEIPTGCATPCHDTDPLATGVGFGIVLYNDGRVYVARHAVLIPGPGPTQNFGSYAAGDRFRVTAKDNNDASGTATITFSRIQGACTPGSLCNEQLITTSSTSARYPFRVDATMIELNATLTDVRVVRIR